MAAVLMLLIVFLQLTAAMGVDRTLEAEASGKSVVRAVVDKIRAVFGDDKQFLRRIAFVESKDGTASGTYRNGYHGGIWQVDMIGFADTQNVASHPGLSAKYEKITEAFNINWLEVEWMDLRKPLYSGIAARLKLLNIPEPIPFDIDGQARYWKQHYNTPEGSGEEQKFIQDVNALNSEDGCKVNSDIMFVLDASGSIGESNFDSVKDFILQYVRNFDIGPDDNQIGVITFSSSARVEFGLNTYSNRASLQQAVSNIYYTDGGTNIPAALCQLLQTYSSNSAGARPDTNVFRVAILMTDGQSNDNRNPCNFATVSEAAMEVHSALPPIVVLTFGVGSEYDPQDVIGIASRPEYANSALSFGALEGVQADQEYDICYRITTPVALEAVNNGLLDQGEQIRWQFNVPEEGTAFDLQVEQGRVKMYASTQTTSPSDAFYEWKAETSSSARVFIQPMIPRNKRDIILNTTTTTTPIYMALFGVDANNVFTLQSSNVSTLQSGNVVTLQSGDDFTLQNGATSYEINEVLLVTLIAATLYNFC